MEEQYRLEKGYCFLSASDAVKLVDTVDFELLGPNLGKDVESAINSALLGGAIFSESHNALGIFRKAIAASICNIESHPRGRLFQEFLLKGPYEDVGEIPQDVVAQRLSDSDTAVAITFIFSHMVNCFKGAIAELLAARPCFNLLRRIQDHGGLPGSARLYVGDTVAIHRKGGKGLLKGADLYILVERHTNGAAPGMDVAGVIEVKSYIQSQSRLREQLDQHIRRAQQGLQISRLDYPSERVSLGHGKHRRVLRIGVLPSAWKLPRSYRYEDSERGRLLLVDKGEPPREDDKITRGKNTDWLVTLRWSKEALAEAAYEMTFWYMSKIGEVIYSSSFPKGWETMTPPDAGRNAAKMMLYYAMLRCRNVREEQRAIALYNSYGFGYALGMNYRNAEGRREMLWPQDLDEILSAGKTKDGCTIC